ncbi:hypothetical protein ACTGJ9_029755 [Bradyrhizobium sp. RDM12]
MGKPAVSRDAFRGLFAFYARRLITTTSPRANIPFLKMFGSADDIPDTLLQQWSDRVELLGSETGGRLKDPRVRQITNGNVQYDHASDFLHTLLRDLGQKMQ